MLPIRLKTPWVTAPSGTSKGKARPALWLNPAIDSTLARCLLNVRFPPQRRSGVEALDEETTSDTPGKDAPASRAPEEGYALCAHAGCVMRTA